METDIKREAMELIELQKEHMREMSVQMEKEELEEMTEKERELKRLIRNLMRENEELKREKEWLRARTLEREKDIEAKERKKRVNEMMKKVQFAFCLKLHSQPTINPAQLSHSASQPNIAPLS